jgi:hypothetical protein
VLRAIFKRPEPQESLSNDGIGKLNFTLFFLRLDEGELHRFFSWDRPLSAVS